MEGKGQTSLDFAAGMSAFLLVFAFVLSFVPTMLQPFAVSDQEETVVADRVADQLTGGLLGDPAEPYRLEVGRTEAFFSTSENELRDRLSLSSSQNVQIELLDSDTTSRLEVSTGEVPDSGSVVAARRYARIGSDDVTIVVRVW